MIRTLLTIVGLVAAWIVLLVAFVAAEAVWFAQPDVARGDFRSIERHLDGALQHAADQKLFGSAAFALVQNGELIAQHGYGTSKSGATDPEQTLFQVASVSKAVTAWGVMKLVQDGRVGLDEPVLTYLKRWKFEGSEVYREKVTIRHLLSHTSGLDDGLGYRTFVPDGSPLTLKDSLDAGAKINSEPGTSFIYGNANYAVLQLLIEDVTERKFSDYMSEAVLKPLGMKSSTFELDVATPNLAPAYDSGVIAREPIRQAAPAAVALYTSAADLARFAAAHSHDNVVLSRDTIRTMIEAQPSTGGTWGLGLTRFADEESGLVVGHDGGALPAWGAMVRVNPRTGNAMSLVVSGGSGSVNRLGHDWTYWETGIVTDQARRQVVYDRVKTLAWWLVGGTVAIVVFVLIRRRRARTS